MSDPLIRPPRPLQQLGLNKTNGYHNDDIGTSPPSSSSSGHFHRPLQQPQQQYSTMKSDPPPAGSCVQPQSLGIASTASSGHYHPSPNSNHVPHSTTEKNVFVGGLDPSIDDKLLQDLLGLFGKVLFCKVMVDLVAGTSKGFGFVTFAEPASAETAIKTLNGNIVYLKKVYENKTPSFVDPNITNVAPCISSSWDIEYDRSKHPHQHSHETDGTHSICVYIPVLLQVTKGENLLCESTNARLSNLPSTTVPHEEQQQSVHHQFQFSLQQQDGMREYLQRQQPYLTSQHCVTSTQEQQPQQESVMHFSTGNHHSVSPLQNQQTIMMRQPPSAATTIVHTGAQQVQLTQQQQDGMRDYLRRQQQLLLGHHRIDKDQAHGVSRNYQPVTAQRTMVMSEGDNTARHLDCYRQTQQQQDSMYHHHHHRSGTNNLSATHETLPTKHYTAQQTHHPPSHHQNQQQQHAIAANRKDQGTNVPLQSFGRAPRKEHSVSDRSSEGSFVAHEDYVTKQIDPPTTCHQKQQQQIVPLSAEQIAVLQQYIASMTQQQRQQPMQISLEQLNARTTTSNGNLDQLRCSSGNGDDGSSSGIGGDESTEASIVIVDDDDDDDDEGIDDDDDNTQRHQDSNMMQNLVNNKQISDHEIQALVQVAADAAAHRKQKKMNSENDVRETDDDLKRNDSHQTDAPKMSANAKAFVPKTTDYSTTPVAPSFAAFVQHKLEEKARKNPPTTPPHFGAQHTLDPELKMVTPPGALFVSPEGFLLVAGLTPHSPGTFIDPARFKTKMCRHEYPPLNSCPFGARCVFAHTEQELQEALSGNLDIEKIKQRILEIQASTLSPHHAAATVHNAYNNHITDAHNRVMKKQAIAANRKGQGTNVPLQSFGRAPPREEHSASDRSSEGQRTLRGEANRSTAAGTTQVQMSPTKMSANAKAFVPKTRYSYQEQLERISGSLRSLSRKLEETKNNGNTSVDSSASNNDDSTGSANNNNSSSSKKKNNNNNNDNSSNSNNSAGKDPNSPTRSEKKAQAAAQAQIQAQIQAEAEAAARREMAETH